MSLQLVPAVISESRRADSAGGRRTTIAGRRATLRVAAALALIALLAGCGSPTPTTNIAQLADQYARQQSGGETLGCGSAAPGAESEANRGCIYSVSFAGCHDGYTGGQLSPMTVEEEFPTEPGLQARYHRAVADCAVRR